MLIHVCCMYVQHPDENDTFFFKQNISKASRGNDDGKRVKLK